MKSSDATVVLPTASTTVGSGGVRAMPNEPRRGAVAFGALLLAIPLLAGLSSCVYGDEIPQEPHGVARTSDGHLEAVACPHDGGIESVEMAVGGADPSEWDETVLDLKADGSAPLRDRVSLDADPAGYTLTRLDDLGYVRVTVFDLQLGNALGTAWDVDLDDVTPGEVATRDGVVSAATWERTCQ